MLSVITLLGAKRSLGRLAALSFSEKKEDGEDKLWGMGEDEGAESDLFRGGKGQKGKHLLPLPLPTTGGVGKRGIKTRSAMSLRRTFQKVDGLMHNQLVVKELR